MSFRSDAAQRLSDHVGRACWLLLVLLLCVVSREPVHGQSLPVVAVDDAAYTLFGRREGLPDGPLYWLSTGTDGRLLVGTSNGTRRLDGPTFASLPEIPQRLRNDIRVVYDQRNGDRVFAEVFSVHVQRGGAFISHVPLGEGRGAIFSALSMPVDEATEQIVVGTSTGPYIMRDGARFAPLELPAGMVRTDAMVASRTVDGAEELWIGTRGGGVARRRNGQWTRYAQTDGLSDLRIEHLAMAPVGDSAAAIVSTGSGAFLLVGERWRPIGPRVDASRALRVLVGANLETWIGTFGGELYRSTDDKTWRPVDVTVRARGSRVQVLQAFSHGLDRPVVYAGFRSGVLLRFRIGIAGRAVLPPTLDGRPVSAFSQGSPDGSFWSWLMGVGAVHFPDLAERRPPKASPLATDGPLRLAVASSVNGPSLFVATDHVIDRYGRTGVQRVLETPVGSGIRNVQQLNIPTQGERIVAFDLDQGWYSDSLQHMVAWSGFPKAVRVLIDDQTATPQRLLAIRQDSVFEYTGSRWTSLPGSMLPRAGSVTSAVTLRLASGECALLVGMTEGVALFRACGGAPLWRVFTEASLPGLLGNETTGLTALPGNRIALGTSGGVVVLDVGPTFAEGLRVVRTFTAADGLPVSNILAVGPIDERNRLWVGTALGAAFVDLSVLASPMAAPALAQFTVYRDLETPISDGATLPSGTAYLDLEVLATSNHREDELRYRFELDGAAMHPTAWIDRNSIRLASLSPGRHVVSVQVHDFDGRRSVIASRSFTVLLPWWQRPAFILLAIVSAVATAFAWERARLSAARERARILEENEQRLAASELRFRRLFEGGMAPQLLLTDGRVRQANAAFGALLGVSADSLSGIDGDRLLPGLGAQLNSTAISAVWEGVLVTMSGSSIPVELQRTRIMLPDLVLEHLEIRDLRTRLQLEREREALEVQLRDTQRMESIGTLAGGVAHDFNNLLTVIHTNAELAAGDTPAESDSGQALQQLLLASTRAREVVRQILTFSRRAAPRKVPVIVRDLLQETESLLRATVPTTMQLVLRNDAPDAVVLGDETQLQQILLNLGANAEYAMRTTFGGVLRITASWVDDAERPLQLSVEDTGIGIPDDVRSRMFEPFFTTKPVGEGTGLGLSVLYGIVQSHGGTVQVTSRLHEGTRVDVRLPASRTASDVSAPSVPLHITVGEPVRVLVVDDEDAVRRSVARLLTRRGYQVETAVHGAEALARINAPHRFALVITDQTMPVMTGWEFVSQLRATGHSIPVIIASGYGLSTEETASSQIPRVWRIDKPFSSDELVGLIHAILEQRV